MGNSLSVTRLRARHGQLVTSCEIGDCFRASMSMLLDVPNGDYLPTLAGDDDRWFFAWQRFLKPFGLDVHTSSAQGPIWKGGFWIASVPSKNCPAPGSHAIVMKGQRVVLDPSRKKVYRAGLNLLGTDLVLAGTWLEVADASKLTDFVKWHRACCGQ